MISLNRSKISLGLALIVIAFFPLMGCQASHAAVTMEVLSTITPTAKSTQVIPSATVQKPENTPQILTTPDVKVDGGSEDQTIPEVKATSPPVEFTGFASIITKTGELKDIEQTNMTPEQINANANAFLQVDETSYRRWVKDSAYYINDNTISATDVNGHPFHRSDTVKRLGLVSISQVGSGNSKSSFPNIQGIVLGTQWIYNPERNMVSAVIYLGIEDGTGKRGIARIFFGNLDDKLTYYLASTTPNGHRSATPGGGGSGSNSPVWAIREIIVDLHRFVGDIVVVKIDNMPIPLKIEPRHKKNNIYYIDIFNGGSGAMAEILLSELIDSHKNKVPANFLLQQANPLDTVALIADLSKFYFSSSLIIARDVAPNLLFTPQK